MGLSDSKRAQRLYNEVAGNRKNCAYEDLERLLGAVGFVKRPPATLSMPRRKPL